MIRAWRERWGQGNFPFGIIQLTKYRGVKAEPEEAPWRFIREDQRQSARTNGNACPIVTNQIGEALRHPTQDEERAPNPRRIEQLTDPLAQGKTPYPPPREKPVT